MAGPIPFAQYLVTKAPPWLKGYVNGVGGFGVAYWRALGDVVDYFVDRTKQSVLAKLPGLFTSTQGMTIAPDDALALIGAERQLPRGLVETSANYAVRLQKAWDVWAQAGSALGLLTDLYNLGYQNPIYICCESSVIYAMNWSTGLLEKLQLDNGAWQSVCVKRATGQSQPPWGEMWSSWELFMNYDKGLPAPPAAPSDWSAALPSANSPEILAIMESIRRWQPGFSTCVGLSVLTAGNARGYWPGIGFEGQTWGGISGSTWADIGGEVTKYPYPF